MGRGNDAHITVRAAIGADALEAALLQHAQDLDLHRQRHVADLVEEQRAAVRHFETAATCGDGAGERALLVAEQFAFEQFGRTLAAGYGPERIGARWEESR